MVTVRRVESGKIMKPITRYVLKNADLVLFNSTYTEKESVAIAQPKKSMVLHNSLDTEKFSPLPQERLNKLREDNHIPREANILLFLGLLVEKKGINYLIEAMPAVLKQYPDTYLIIAGHGSEEQKLKDMVTRFRIQDKVIFTGHVDAKTTPTYFNLADVFVCPSIIDSKGDTETLGVVVLEALSCETPVVASRIGGVPDILTPDCGILVPQKDPLALHEAICDLLKDKKKREAIETRNMADTLVHSTEKMLTEYGDKVDADTKAKIEKEVSELRELLKADDTEKIKKKLDEVQQVSQEIGMKMYRDAAAKQAEDEKKAKPQAEKGGDVVDAEFEVDDEKGKKKSK